MNTMGFVEMNPIRSLRIGLLSTNTPADLARQNGAAFEHFQLQNAPNAAAGTIRRDLIVPRLIVFGGILTFRFAGPGLLHDHFAQYLSSSRSGFGCRRKTLL